MQHSSRSKIYFIYANIIMITCGIVGSHYITYEGLGDPGMVIDHDHLDGPSSLDPPIIYINSQY